VLRVLAVLGLCHVKVHSFIIIIIIIIIIILGQQSGRQEVAIFQQTAAKFRRRRLWLLKSSILPRNSPKFRIFGRKFSEENYRIRQNFQQAKIYGGGGVAPPATTPLSTMTTI